jgi:hypothetical protein
MNKKSWETKYNHILILILQENNMTNVKKINYLYKLFSKRKGFIGFIHMVDTKLRQNANIYDDYPELNPFVREYINDFERLKYYIWNDRIDKFADDDYVKFSLINLYNKYEHNTNILCLSKEEIKLLVKI